MGDTALLKDFRHKDIQRIRNLYSGKADSSTSTQVGYTKGHTHRKEGDVWTEDGLQWTIENGIKQSYSKLSAARKSLTVPLMCPCCKTRMKDKLDPRFYNLYGKCFSCVQAYESQLKREGKYDEYARNIMNANAMTFISDARDYLNEIAKSSNKIYAENGQEENWSGPNVNSKMIEQMNKELDGLEERVSK
jgi:hypothetical protein